jgi:hypothetical protein
MTRTQYDEIWHQPQRIRAFVEELARAAPELFPVGFDQEYRLHGFGRTSRKLPGLKLRKIITINPARKMVRQHEDLVVSG